MFYALFHLWLNIVAEITCFGQSNSFVRVCAESRVNRRQTILHRLVERKQTRRFVSPVHFVSKILAEMLLYFRLLEALEHPGLFEHAPLAS